MKTEILPAVSAIIFNNNGDILMQKRMDTKKWCIISGHVEFGETVEEAMIREVREETNVESEILRLIGVYSSPTYATYHYPERIVQYVVTYFEVKLKEEIKSDWKNHESEAFAYFHLDKLPENLDLMNPYWLTDALDRNARAFVR